MEPSPATDALPVPEDPSLWSSLKDALRGAHHDHTEGPLGRAIFLLSVPMVLEMVMESIFAVVDVFVVGKLGKDAVSTVGLTEALITLIYAAAMGLSIGAMAVVARRTGEKDPEAAARAAVQGIILGVAFAIPVAVLGAIFAPQLLALMGAEQGVLQIGSTYARVMMASTVSILLLFLLNAVFRGSGDAAIAMRVLWLANGINVVLAPCLVFGVGPFPELGVTGAAVATTLGRSVGVLYQLLHLASGKGRINIARRHLRLEPDTMKGILKLSGSAVLQTSIGLTSWVALVRIISSFGSQAVAAYTITMRMVIFALLPSWGLGNAAATLVGQNLGAKKPERAEAAVWRAGLYNVVFLGSLSILFLVFADPLCRAFSDDPEVARLASLGLRILSAGFVFYAYGMVMGQSFNGAGDTRTPTLINLCCFWLFELPLAWFLAHVVGLGPKGAFIAVLLAFASSSVAGAYLFRKGRWKTQAV